MSWEEIDAHKQTYYGVTTTEDYSFTPESVFGTEQAAHEYIAWQKTLWDEETEAGINPGAETWVLELRFLEGEFWNSYEDSKTTTAKEAAQ